MTKNKTELERRNGDYAYLLNKQPSLNWLRGYYHGINEEIDHLSKRIEWLRVILPDTAAENSFKRGYYHAKRLELQHLEAQLYKLWDELEALDIAIRNLANGELH